MNFQYPDFLWGLLALMVPLLIHLFTFRRYKTVYFSNVRYLGNIKRSTRKRSQLKHLIIMALRMLALAALVLAFALPYLPEVSGEKAFIENEVALFVDNSFSMESVNEKGPLLEDAKNSAIEIVNSFPADTRFFVFTNDFRGRDQYPKSKAEAIRAISSIVISSRPIDFRKIGGIRYESEFIGARKVFILSDYQTNSSDLAALKKDTLSNISLVRIPSIQTGNLYIDSCRFVSPVHRANQKEVLEVWISNRSNEDLLDVPVKFFVNDSLTAVANFSVMSNSRVKTILKFTNSATGVRKGRLVITDYPVIYDNEFLLSWWVEKKRDVLAVVGDKPEETEQILSALFRDDPFIELDMIREGEVKVSELPDYSTIILANMIRFPSGLTHELVKYADGGGNLVLFPSQRMDEANQLLKQAGAPVFERFDTLDARITDVNFDHQVYKEVFRKQQKEISPIPVQEYFQWKIRPEQKGEFLLLMNNRQPALFILPVKQGSFSVFVFPLQYNAFSRHSLFVSTLYNLMIYSRYHEPLWYTLGESHVLTINNGFNDSENLSVTDLKTGEQFIPETWTNAENQLQIKVGEKFADAGFYQVGTHLIAMNYNRRESDLRCFSEEELQEKIEKEELENVRILSGGQELTSELEGESTQRNLWKWLLVAALLFLLIEGLVCRVGHRSEGKI